jgi:hypothetical protein
VYIMYINVALFSSSCRILHAVTQITLLLHVAFRNIPSYNHPQVMTVSQIWDETLQRTVSKHIVYRLVLPFVVSAPRSLESLPTIIRPVRWKRDVLPTRLGITVGRQIANRIS